MLLRVKALADDPLGRHHRQGRHLLPQLFHRLRPLLLNLGPGFRDQAFGLLTRLGFQFSAQVLRLLGDPVEHRLRLAPSLLELHLAFSFRLLQLALGAFGRLDTLLDPLPALVQDPQEWVPGDARQAAQHHEEDQQLSDQRAIEREQPGVEAGHFPVIWPNSGLAKIRNRPRPRPMIGSASMNPIPMIIRKNSRPCSSGWRAVPSTVRLGTNPSPIPAPSALSPSRKPKATTVAPKTIARSKPNPP